MKKARASEKKASNIKAVTKPVAAKPIVRIGILLHDVARMRKTIFDQNVKELGITRAQWWALSNISRNVSEGITQSELARVLNVGKPTIGGLIDRLIEKGLVKRRSYGDNRRSNGDDRRLKNIVITDDGYDLITDMSPIASNLNTIFLDGISEKNIAIAEEVLEQMKSNLQRLLESGPALELAKTIASKHRSVK